MGLSDDRNYTRYHHVLNRAAWISKMRANAATQSVSGPNPHTGGLRNDPWAKHGEYQ